MLSIWSDHARRQREQDNLDGLFAAEDWDDAPEGLGGVAAALFALTILAVSAGLASVIRGVAAWVN